ncbi:NADH-quinone oxidoreductase subunit M [Patulibacter sp. NPDC049589]|uniref:complex I subunit 4 family protein n=1 Tax=Patulibacter sp. NPDC049589 TaxID=3154731 RepID=UPI00343DDA93
MPWLTLTIVLPFLGAALTPLLPARPGRAPLLVALGATALAGVCVIATWIRFDPADGMQLVEQATWIPSLGVAWRLGVDGMSLALVALTVVLFLVAIIHGLGPAPMSRAAAGLLLLLEASCLAYFLAEDFFLFYIAFDVTLVAMYFLIALWGGERRRYAALKFFLYTLIGSLPVLLGIIAMVLASDHGTFDMIRLADEQPIAGTGLGASLAFVAFFAGFAIKTPIVPFHTWLPAAHVEAPTSGSVLLAGVLLKLGTYGLIRVNLQMMPEAFQHFALPVALLGLVSALYGSLVALAQTDLKRLVAYTSINHMGYIVIGIAAAAATGISDRGRELAIDGAVLQMIAHGIVTSGLFLLAGMIAEKTGTRDLRRLGGLFRPLPVLGAVVSIMFFASLGLPGLAQFPAELQLFLGAFDAFPVVGALAVSGIVITAGLFLLALQRAFMGRTPERLHDLADLTRRERATLAPLLLLTVVLGIYPRLALDAIHSASWLL